MMYLIDNTGLVEIATQTIQDLFCGLCDEVDLLHPDMEEAQVVYWELLNMEDVLFTSPALTTESYERYIGKVDTRTATIDTMLMLVNMRASFDKDNITVVTSFHCDTMMLVGFQLLSRFCYNALVRNSIIDNLLESL